MEEKEYLSKEKFEELKSELDHLKKIKRREVAENLEYAKSMGDLAENAEYQEAREVQAEVEERINKLEQIMKNAEIVSTHRGGTVSISATVTIKKDGEKDEKKYLIVGSEESDISKGKISNHSPLGMALMGKVKGDTFDFITPKGKVKYKIIDVK